MWDPTQVVYDRWTYVSACNSFPIRGASRPMLNSLNGHVLTTSLPHKHDDLMLWLQRLSVRLRSPTCSFGVIIGAEAGIGAEFGLGAGPGEDAVVFQDIADLEFALAFQPAVLEHPARVSARIGEGVILVLEARQPAHSERVIYDILRSNLGPIDAMDSRRTPGLATITRVMFRHARDARRAQIHHRDLFPAGFLIRITLHATDGTAGTAGVDGDGSTADVHALAATIGLAETEAAPHVGVWAWLANTCFMAGDDLMEVAHNRVVEEARARAGRRRRR